MTFRVKTLALAAAGLVAASPAFAIEVSKSAEIAAAPDSVWKMIGTFCDIQNWHPAVKKCELKQDGGKNVRTLTLPDGATLVEEEVSRDDDKMSYTYKILEGPLPVENYESTISVSGSGDSATVDWSGHFDAKGASDDKASEVIGGIYDAGLASLKEKAGKM
ncbi:SRPBCC family protein [Jiella sonneratiae]|uniref:SRPBCC family protein n=1 Tax=Jiella sonneratiae TaxID=2816856 RepID=A0ABS3IYW8_9HYPH|nr:SRPBCC family protein [Jiella sonneratiae]MBO0902608.1 SRPBCC family protein [Jiella sonneratiae]